MVFQAHNAKRRANAEQDRLELAEAAAIEAAKKSEKKVL